MSTSKKQLRDGSTWTRRGTTLLILSAVCVGCSHPTEIKTAAQLQLSAQGEAEQAAVQYMVSVDRFLARASQIQDDAVLVTAASQAVARADQDGDILAASDKVASEIFKQRRQQAQTLSTLERLRINHRQNLTSLVEYLRLLQRSQELIVRFLTTDVGPTATQVTALSQEIENLAVALSGGQP